jgi:hypothetical protein
VLSAGAFAPDPELLHPAVRRPTAVITARPETRWDR